MEKVFYAAMKAGRIKFEDIPAKYQAGVQVLIVKNYLADL